MTVYRFAELDSTQDEARRRIATGHAKIGDVVICDRQTAGRGRHGRRWVSPSGGLYATYILASGSHLGIGVGVAAAETMRSLGIDVFLKWPNDLVIDDQKIGGILIEAIEDIALAGIGINLDESPHAMATCARAHDVVCDRDSLIDQLAVRLGAASDEGVVEAYRRVSATLGRRVRIEQKRGTLVGTAVDVNGEGHLIVDRGSERVTVASGACLHLRDV